jgi:hypothetical protein
MKESISGRAMQKVLSIIFNNNLRCKKYKMKFNPMLEK